MVRSPLRTRALSAFAGASLAFGLAACTDSPPADDDAGGGEDTGSIEVWSRSGPQAAAVYEEIFEAFTEKTGIEVEYVATVEFDEQLQGRIASRNLPDVLIYYSDYLARYINEGIIQPIDVESIEGHDDISEASWESVQALDGEHYGVPFSRHAKVTLIRKDWREKLGYDIPTTLEEEKELAAAFTTEDPDGNGQDDTYGIGVQGTMDRGYFAWWAASYIWRAGGEYISRDGDTYTVEINSPESVAAVQWLKGLFCDQPVVVQPGALQEAHPQRFFAEGGTGIYLTAPYHFPEMDLALGEDTYEVVPPPEGPGGRTTIGERTTIYVTTGEEPTSDELALAEFMASPEGQTIGMKSDADHQAVVRLPVNTTLDPVEVTGDERLAVVEEAAEIAQEFPTQIDFPAIRQDIAEALNRTMSNCSSDVQAEMDAVADLIADELDSQGVLGS